MMMRQKKWAIRALGNLIHKKGLMHISGVNIFSRDLFTLQMVQAEHAKTEGFFSKPIGRTFTGTIEQLRKQGLVEYSRKKKLLLSSYSRFSGLVLTKKGFKVLASSTMMGVGTTIQTAPRRN